MLGLFRDENQKYYSFAPGQRHIFELVVGRQHKYNQIIATSQYGKSLTIALGILFSAACQNQKWAIVAPTTKKAGIIMNYIIQHAFDNAVFYGQLLVESSFEKLKRERTRSRLVFKNGGEIFIVSAEGSNKKRAGQALMGFGAPNLALDESSLLDDEIYATAIRMVGGTQKHCIIEIGNPFNRNHFFDTYNDPSYNHVRIDYKQAIQEGRLTQDFIDRMSKLPFFEVLYGCNFPDEEGVDAKGYLKLISEEILKIRMAKPKPELKGKPKLGVDIGAGGDASVYVIRWDNYSKVLEKNHVADTMHQVKTIRKYIEQYKIYPAHVFVDDNGVGQGVSNRLHELDVMITPIKNSQEAIDKERFINIRAENNWLMRLWLLDEANAIDNNKEYLECAKIKYKEDSGSSRLKIQPKEEMKKILGHSPDTSDAFALTFAPAEEEPEIFFI